MRNEARESVTSRRLGACASAVRRQWASLLAVGLVVGAGGCRDVAEPAAAPAPTPVAAESPDAERAGTTVTFATRCEVTVRTGALRCDPAVATSEQVRDAQGNVVSADRQVRESAGEIRILTAWSAYDVATHRIRMQIGFHNLTRFALGSADGQSTDPAGVRMVIETGPTVTSGAGSTSVGNPDGVATFTAPSQPFWRYVEFVQPNGKNEIPKVWEFNADPTVATIGFGVVVFARVVYEGSDLLPPRAFYRMSSGSGEFASHTCGVRSGGTVYCWGDASDGQTGTGERYTMRSPLANIDGLLFTALSAGTETTCGIATGGLAYCWGDNASLQMGVGNLAAGSRTPFPVSGNLAFVGISTSRGDPRRRSDDTQKYHTCAIAVGGAGYCWGTYSNGQLGDGRSSATYAADANPAAVSGGRTFTQIVTGATHSCGLAGGKAYCWGTMYQTAVAAPVAVPGDMTFSSITSGTNHVCALTPGGQAYCWGQNGSGQFGIGSATAGSTTPVAVSGGLTFQRISAGFTHTCGVTTAGAAYCWGANDFGKLGDGTTVARYVPTLVPGGYTFTSIAAGDYHTCALGTNGFTYCWGDDFPDLPGYRTGYQGPRKIRSTVPSIGINTPTLVEVVAADGNTCGRTAAGVATCWGDNFAGKTGLTVTAAYVQRRAGLDFPIGILGPYALTSVAAGGVTVPYSRGDLASPIPGGAGTGFNCGLTSGGYPVCWGANNHGQLGTTTALVAGESFMSASFTPLPVDGGHLFNQYSISAGDGHVCALKSDNTAWCWGRNDAGQRGVASAGAAPNAVNTAVRFTSIRAGGQHTCALTGGGRLYCWGANTEGQLGIGTTTGTTATPTATGDQLTFAQISAGRAHTCGVTTANAIYCWGRNSEGQLGDGTQQRRTIPTKVPVNLTFVAVAVGPRHSCGIVAGGATYCWGSNVDGQLGVAGTISTLPVAVPAGRGFQDLALGISHTCGLGFDEKLYCWGGNLSGDLGTGSLRATRIPVTVIDLP